MDEPAIALILDECLALLDAGEAPEAIAGRFPDAAERLLPLLQIALALRDGADEALDVPADLISHISEFLGDRIDDVQDTIDDLTD